MSTSTRILTAAAVLLAGSGLAHARGDFRDARLVAKTDAHVHKIASKMTGFSQTAAFRLHDASGAAHGALNLYGTWKAKSRTVILKDDQGKARGQMTVTRHTNGNRSVTLADHSDGGATLRVHDPYLGFETRIHSASVSGDGSTASFAQKKHLQPGTTPMKDGRMFPGSTDHTTTVERMVGRSASRGTVTIDERYGDRRRPVTLRYTAKPGGDVSYDR